MQRNRLQSVIMIVMKNREEEEDDMNEDQIRKTLFYRK